MVVLYGAPPAPGSERFLTGKCAGCGVDLFTLAIGHGNFDSAAHWSYSGFSRYRKRLAATIGMDLDSMRGFGGTNPYEVKPYGQRKTKTKVAGHQDCAACHPPQKNMKARARREPRQPRGRR